ncbi:MAG: hypothetical protein NC218_02055 [Acetobacter sp.]|nr:hypothetical protein [Acetobacter sp.]
MTTLFGPQAQEGDYVLVLHTEYKLGKANCYLAKVHNGKAYTGHYDKAKRCYLHKMTAQVVVSPDIVPEELKEKIEKDIANMY